MKSLSIGGVSNPAFSRSQETVIRDRIRESAQQLVADALVTPFLAKLRESVGQLSSEGNIFKQTDAEKRLGPVVDSGIADRLVKGSNWAIVDRVEESLLARAGLKPRASERVANASHAGMEPRR